MNAFVTATPVLARLTAFSATTPARRRGVFAPERRGVSMKMGRFLKGKIPQRFTTFSERVNGRAAMVGFVVAIVIEAITGKGVIGQLGAVFDVVNGTIALGN